jgi:hypothetical protein
MIGASKLVLLFLSPLLLVCAAPAEAQMPSGMAAEQYFLGTWACTAGPVKNSTLYKIKITFASDSEIMREWDAVEIPGQTAPYSISKSIAWDAKNRRWVQTQVDNQGQWRVSYLKPWVGNTEEWLDQSSSDGKLGRDETVRTGAEEFAFSSYTSPSDATASMVGNCVRST